MLINKDWIDYKLIKTSNGEKLEKWGKYKLLRPDPVIVWDCGLFNYSEIDAKYNRSNKGGGYWDNYKNVPSSWIINYKDLKFNIKEMGFKHTGIFPEQAINWDFAREKIRKSNKKDIKVLNLFAYTGAMSVALLKEGASVVHVDSSRGMIDWAKENVKINNLENASIRYLIDDCIKFVKREIRRGNKYDAIIMDPPSYGRGANGEVFDLSSQIDELVTITKEILKEDFLFYIVNTYSTNLPLVSLENILKLKFGGKHIEVHDLCLEIQNESIVLPCGITARVTNE